MLIRTRRAWELPESAATPEPLFMNRRRLLRGAGLAAGAGLLPAALTRASIAADPMADDPTADLYPVPRNPAFTLDRDLTPETLATTYNNFYEFGSHKQIYRAAQALPIRPWTVTFDGMVEEERTVDIDTLIRALPLEERLYRFRCVEAWSMAVPWSGTPMAALIDYARPLGSARYVVMQTFEDSTVATGQRQFWYPWPYTEGLTLAEATNELAFLATGLYGKPMPKQNGAPIRLVVPWKYGFKSVKSIVRFHFTDERPVTFWEALAADEYGFWANVNPEVAHPRWSQSHERMLGASEQRPTLLYNGYAEQVAHLYEGLEDERLYR